MLAISFALALAFHEPLLPIVHPDDVSVQASAAMTAANQQLTDITLVPYGMGYGSYVYDTGHMLALVEDASGAPLWVLNAFVYEWGGLDGNLLPLEYANSPVDPDVELSVSGGVLFDEQGRGTFHAVIFQYNGGAIPVFPVGQLEGVIQPPALGQVLPVLAGASDLVAVRGYGAGYGPQVAQRGILVCPKGPSAGFDAVGTMGQAGFGAAGIGAPILCPKGPDESVQSVGATGGIAQAGAAFAGSGSASSTSALGHQLDGGAIVCPAGPVLGSIQAAGALGQAGQGLYESGADLIVDPAQAALAGSGGTAQSALGVQPTGAQILPLLQGPDDARVALRWWMNH